LKKKKKNYSSLGREGKQVYLWHYINLNWQNSNLRS